MCVCVCVCVCVCGVCVCVCVCVCVVCVCVCVCGVSIHSFSSCDGPKVEPKILEKLDDLLEGGCGDEEYKDLFSKM